MSAPLVCANHWIGWSGWEGIAAIQVDAAYKAAAEEYLASGRSMRYWDLWDTYVRMLRDFRMTHIAMLGTCQKESPFKNAI